jgi:hypothetical protein
MRKYDNSVTRVMISDSALVTGEHGTMNDEVLVIWDIE